VLFPVAVSNFEYISDFNGTTGLPMPSTYVVLLDDKNHPVPIGQAGEVCVKGPQVTTGYWRQPEANATAFTGDGFFRTDDIGVFDRNSLLKIVYRKMNMVEGLWLQRVPQRC